MNQALICAARAGDLDATRLLLQSGASPEATDNSANSPLIEAASSGVSQVVEEVLKHHPNINARNQLGKTAIFAAAVYCVSWEDHDID
jgi:ankyrin repeat protein